MSRPRLSTAATVAVALYSVSSPWIRPYPLELGSHFQAQWLAFHLVLAIVLAVAGRRRLALVPAAAALFHAALVASVLVPAGPRPHPAFRALWINLKGNVSNVGKVRALIERERPDVIALCEFQGKWLDALPPSLPAYPYKKFTSRERGGLALFSRLPVDDARFAYYDGRFLTSLEARIQVDGRWISLIATHPLSPRNRGRFRRRNGQLEGIAAERPDGPLLVLGDLNSSMWSHYYRRLLKEMNVRNGRDGFGLLPSWPAGLPGLRIPIDHALLSPELGVADIRTAPPVGSDHLPLIVDVGWAIPSTTNEAGRYRTFLKPAGTSNNWESSGARSTSTSSR